MHLFVYGTLRRSAAHPMHRLLLSAHFVGAGRFQGKLFTLGNYPAATSSSDAADIVHGEVYLLRELASTLAALDHYEGCHQDDPEPHEYVRKEVRIHLASGDNPIVTAQIYLYIRPVENLAPIASGDYLEWLAPRSSSSNAA